MAGRVRGTDAVRPREQCAKIGVGIEPAVPAGIGLVEQQAIRGAAGIGERTHEAGRVEEAGKGVDRVGAALPVVGQAQANAGVFRDSFVDFQRGLVGGGLVEQAAALVPEGERIGNAVAPRPFVIGHQRLGERAPLQLQQVAALPHVEVAVARLVACQPQVALDAVEHLVHQEHAQHPWFKRHRPHQLRPLGARPFDARVGQHDLRGQLANEGPVAGLQHATAILLVGNHAAVDRVDDHDRPAQRPAPQRAVVALAQPPGFLEHVQRAGLARACRGGRHRLRDQAGEQEKGARTLAHGRGPPVWCGVATRTIAPGMGRTGHGGGGACPVRTICGGRARPWRGVRAPLPAPAAAGSG